MKNPESGFSLVEVMAALVVFSIAAMALINLNTETVSSARQLDLKVLAEIEAENHMARLWLSPDQLSAGIRTGESEILGQPLLWSETITALPNSDLMQINVAIQDIDTDQVLMQLSAIRRQP